MTNAVNAVAYREGGGEAQELLMEIGKPAEPYLIKALNTPGQNYHLRHNAAATLQAISGVVDWTVVYINDLKYCLGGGQNQKRRRAAVEYLGKQCDRRAIPQLRESARNDHSVKIRLRCKWVLKKCYGF